MKTLYKILTVLMLVVVMPAMAQQQISVESFKLDDMNTTALNKPEYDNMGNPCALIIVHNATVGKFRFNLNVWSKVEPAEIDGEKVYLVWVPDGTNTMTISNDDRSILPLENYYFQRVRRTKTYNMVLGTIIQLGDISQFLKFHITPANASLEVDGVPWQVDKNGNAYQNVKLGKHTYEVAAPGYYTEQNTVLMDKDEPKDVNVKLYLNSGFLTIDGGADFGDAAIFIDKVSIGNGNIKRHQLLSGTHTLTITRQMFDPYKTEITIKDEQETVVRPVMKGNFVTPTIRCADSQASIYVDNAFVGTGTYKGRLGLGAHVVEVRRDHHRPYRDNLTVGAGDDGRVFDIQAPTPICGSLTVESTPSGATVYIDGEQRGTTPYQFNNLLEGDHAIRLTQPGYTDYESSVRISEGQNSLVKGEMAQGKKSKTFNVNGVQFTMVYVEGGTFQMGATPEQSKDYSPDSDEKPVHSVTLSDYYIGETEVTQELWQAVMGGNPSSGYSWDKGKGAKYPAYYISYNECKDFIKKLNSLTGENFRMPTEAEWEFAARGGNKSKGYVFSGSNNINDVAWYNDNSGGGTHPVGTKAPNELGIYDMSGNVWEWCNDWYVSYSGNAQTNPKGPSSGSNRVDRGGSWYRYPSYCRVSNRYDSNPGNHGNGLGLRLAL